MRPPSCLLKILSVVLPALLLGGCRTAPESAEAARELAVLMSERLSIARDVARDKHRTQAPVHDPVREAAILAALSVRAAEHGVRMERAEAFFAAQIAASRQVQNELLARWAAGEPLPAGTPPDLKTELRPRLDALTDRMLDALARTDRGGAAGAVVRLARTRLETDGFSPATIDFALAPIKDRAEVERRSRAASTRDAHRRMRVRPLTPP